MVVIAPYSFLSIIFHVHATKFLQLYHMYTRKIRKFWSENQCCVRFLSFIMITFFSEIIGATS